MPQIYQPCIAKTSDAVRSPDYKIWVSKPGLVPPGLSGITGAAMASYGY
ncbi:MAG: hypothetical protein WCA84_14030 [Ignavibacteriaceae bacterium]